IDYKSFDGGDLHLRMFTLDSQNHLIQLGSSRMIGVTSQSVQVSVTAGEPLVVWVYGFNHSEATYQVAVTRGEGLQLLPLAAWRVCYVQSAGAIRPRLKRSWTPMPRNCKRSTAPTRHA